MSDYIIFFSVLALTGIFYLMYYKQFVFLPKVQKLNLANEFRYARSLNNELVRLFTHHATDLDQHGHLFNGLTYEAAMLNLQTWQTLIYTDATFKLLVRHQQKAKREYIEKLKGDITEQIKVQHEVKANINRALNRRKLIAAA